MVWPLKNPADNARLEAKRTIKQESQQVEKIFKETEDFVYQLRNDLQKNITDLIQQLGKSSLNSVERAVQKYELELHTIINITKEKTLAQADIFVQDTNQRLVAVEQTLAQKTMDGWEEYQETLRQEQRKHIVFLEGLRESNKAILEEMNQRYSQDLQAVVVNAKERTLTQVEGFVQEMHLSVEAVEKSAAVAMSQSLSNYEKDLQAKKQQKLETASAEIKKIIPIALREALGDMLSNEQHEQVVSEALNVVKKSLIW